MLAVPDLMVLACRPSEVTASSMALPQQIARFEAIEAIAEPVTRPDVAPRIRRCTFRRLSRISSGGAPAYGVNCLYPDRKLPLPIGDLESSLAICESCSASHIFRPDED